MSIEEVLAILKAHASVELADRNAVPGIDAQLNNRIGLAVFRMFEEQRLNTGDVEEAQRAISQVIQIAAEHAATHGGDIIRDLTSAFGVCPPIWPFR
jgi:hypothetical protein